MCVCVCVCLCECVYVCVCLCMCALLHVSVFVWKLFHAHFELLQKDHIENKFTNFCVFDYLGNFSKILMKYNVFMHILLNKHTYKQAKVFITLYYQTLLSHSKENFDFFKNKRGVLSKYFLLNLWYKMIFFKLPPSKIWFLITQRVDL